MKADVIDPNDPTVVAQITHTGPARGVIVVRSDIFNGSGSTAAWVTMMHEVGHLSNFGDINDPTCSQTVTIMRTNVDFSQPTANGFTEVDLCAANGSWRGGDSPIFIALDGGALAFSSPDDGVPFDLTGCGSKPLVAWPTRPAIGLLALDLNGNGVIDDGSELFGNYTRLPDGRFADNGYEALQAYDADGNGVIDSSDPIYWRLVVWTDDNRDGVSQPGELRSLSELNIVSISIDYHDAHRVDKWGNEFRFHAAVTLGNPSRVVQSWDVFLKVKPNN